MSMVQCYTREISWMLATYAIGGPSLTYRLHAHAGQHSMCSTLDCKLGGLRIIQHNEVRDTIAQCMKEAGHTAVEIEPHYSRWREKRLSTNQRTRMKKHAATSSAAGSGVG